MRSEEIEMVCKSTPLLAGDWDRGDTLGCVCVVIGGDMCVCVCSLLCVSAYPLVRAHVVCAYGMAISVAGKSFRYVAVHVRNSLRSSRSDTHTHIDRAMHRGVAAVPMFVLHPSP